MKGDSGNLRVNQQAVLALYFVLRTKKVMKGSPGLGPLFFLFVYKIDETLESGTGPKLAHAYYIFSL